MRRAVREGRQAVLDRRRLQGAGRQAAGRRQGPAGEGVRRRDLQGQEGQAGAARSRRSSATTSSSVDKINKASQQSLEQATPTIKQLLPSQNQQKALDTFVKDFRKRWKDKTDCRERLRDAGLQERAEADADAHAGAASPAGDPTPTRHARHLGTRRVSRPRRSPRRSRRLDELTRRLRRECPWDREQDERSIVPHTVEEAYELAAAAHARRRRQAARRARRRPLPGPLPVAAARGARRRLAGRGRRALPRRS